LIRKPVEEAGIEGPVGMSSLVGLPLLCIRASSEVAWTLDEELSFNLFIGGCPPADPGLDCDVGSGGGCKPILLASDGVFGWGRGELEFDPSSSSFRFVWAVVSRGEFLAALIKLSPVLLALTFVGSGRTGTLWRSARHRAL